MIIYLCAHVYALTICSVLVQAENRLSGGVFSRKLIEHEKSGFQEFVFKVQ